METIEKAPYEGYIWLSNRQKPLVISPDKPNVSHDTDNSFIVEGNLWNETDNVSIMIKYVDGKYIVRRTVVTDECRKNATEKEFIAHRIDGVKKLKFLQYWVETVDALCEGMTTLRPGKLVFVGFSK